MGNNPFEIFDFISPLLRDVRDIHHAITNGEEVYTPWVPADQKTTAVKVLKDKGIKVISTTATSGDPRIGLTIAHKDVKKALLILTAEGIETEL